MRRLLSLLPAAALAGCAALPGAPARTVHYRCDQGREFAATFPAAGESVRIDVARMQFNLDAAGPDGDGRRYSCGTLTFRQAGATARLEMAETDIYDHCHEEP